ncbi:prolyl oligopeptidase family protein [Prosthecobacter fusiformis]|uniref:Prolyl oligopeptidase family protein n=1 Tax=Prosthecobacter fusiformis TaxID=48464 RepID=A0A4V3FE94_9BACT|nr:alpha/beta fold hydrolase [Prosthecobacter fusiformis]TDU66163.1 prolyl oligopeptidase family protein [Prosthecobacter fusiformis]
MQSIFVTGIFFLACHLAYAQAWPPNLQHIQVRSSADQTEQPALAWSPPGTEARPLLVGLHTWSSDYKQSSNGRAYAHWCSQMGWHFIAPNFRGPNNTPEAMGSDLAVQDVVDAVEHMKKSQAVDTSRIYLIGVSGGGHMAMLMAGRHPEIWAGVSAWCGISDIAAWHSEHLRNGRPDGYAQNIEASLGGPPTDARLQEAIKRSPLTWLSRARQLPLDLNHGIQDGRLGSVPFRHSLLAFNQAAAETLPDQEIQSYYETQQRPSSWPAPEPDPLYISILPPGSKRPGWMPGSTESRLLKETLRTPKPVLFRKISGSTRITLFDGAHEIIYNAGLNWLAAQQKGTPVVWDLKNPILLESGDTQSGL